MLFLYFNYKGKQEGQILFNQFQLNESEMKLR